MERRIFLQNAAIVSALTAGTQLAGKKLTNVNSEKGNFTPLHYKRSIANARQMPGFLLNFIISEEQTGGQFSMIEGMGLKGAEPPMHVHEHEDEAFYMIDGEMIAICGDEQYHLKPGDFAFLPRRIPHTQKFITDRIHVLITISPAGFEQYFRDLTMPADNLDIPAISMEPPSPEMMNKMMEINEKYGISMV